MAWISSGDFHTLLLHEVPVLNAAYMGHGRYTYTSGLIEGGNVDGRDWDEVRKELEKKLKDQLQLMLLELK